MVTDKTGSWPPVGPLTTVFTPPASCLKNLYYGYYNGAETTVTLGIFTQQPECYPTSYWEDYWGQRSSTTLGYYSPAICPSGYTSACSRQSSDILGPGYTVGPAVLSGEVAMNCCPSNYVCHPTLQYYCSSTIQTMITATLELSGTSIGTKIVGTNAEAHAFGIQVRYQDSDLPVLALAGFTPSSTSPQPTTTSMATPNTVGASITASLHSPSPSIALTITTSIVSYITPPTPSSKSVTQSGLSRSAEIGVGVSIPLFVVLVALAARVSYTFYRRRKKREDVRAGKLSAVKDIPELHNTTATPAVFEADGDRHQSELPSQRILDEHDQTSTTDNAPATYELGDRSLHNQPQMSGARAGNSAERNQ